MKSTYYLPVLFLSLVGHSQTVNTGDLYVATGTIFSTISNFDNQATGTFINNGDTYIYANFNNDGVVDFASINEGLTRFVGSSVQTISGNNFSYLYDALFDNGSAQYAFNLEGDISITGESDFTTGIVDNTLSAMDTNPHGGIFQYEQLATHIGAGDDSHIDGPVLKVGDQSFEYPIGDSGYFRHASISAPDEATDTFTAEYYFETTNNRYPVNNLDPALTLIDNAEHWVIEQLAGNSEVFITLSWRNDTTPAEILATPLENNIHIARWDETLQLWVDQGGIVNATNQTVTTAVDSYGVFTLARGHEQNIMPCPLTIYNLITPNNDSMNDFFEVRQAINGTSCASNMNVKIFNRWGVKVFDADNYELGNNLFKGFSDGRSTIAKDELLPTGTYYYILTFNYENNGQTQSFKKADYLYIND